MSAGFAWRAPAVWFRGDPFEALDTGALAYDSDAVVVVRDGRIAAFGSAAAVLPGLPPDVRVERYPHALMVPGFIDCHVHYPQLGIIGASGYSLLEWLQRLTFPAEQAFADPEHARGVAQRFLAELALHGTTSALVFGTVHAVSADALFEAAAPTGLRIVAGKCLMDCNAPDGLRDTAASGYEDSKRLIARWHGRGRLGYAVTPRFVATSSPEQLASAGALIREHPGVWLQSHLSETLEEIALVRGVYPEAADYVDVFERFGLLGPRTILGHGIHLSACERDRLAATGTVIAHCPTSNLCLGSGLFDLAAMRATSPPVAVGLATDVGAGTTLSMLHTMAAAMHVAALRGNPLPPSRALWLATAGAARALGLGHATGNLAAGLDADVVLLDCNATPLLEWRTRQADDPESLLGVLMTLGDDRTVARALAGGKLVKPAA